MSAISRRRLLQLGGGALAVGLAGGRAMAGPRREPGEMRIGAVLPTQTGPIPVPGHKTYLASADAARQGIVMAEEDYAAWAARLGRRLKVFVSAAPTAQAARRAAARLTATQGVHALIGGFGIEQTLALGELADQRRVPFFNIAASSDRLRGEACSRYTFHVQASAAMYLQAMAAWHERAGHRRYFFVVADSAEQRAHYQGMRSALAARDFGAEEAGHAMVAQFSPAYGDSFNQIRQVRPDVIILMLDGVAQLDFLGQFESSGLTAIPVTGYPSAVAQTRGFYYASQKVSPHAAGGGYRTALWEATLEADGAGELNARFLARWGQPMDPSAWAGYEAVKMLYEAAALSGTLEGKGLRAWLEHPHTSFDVHKGVPVSFRPWNHQLRQTLYRVKIDPDAKRAVDLATLVGELPAADKPGTAAIERLDRLGVAPSQSQCDFG